MSLPNPDEYQKMLQELDQSSKALAELVPTMLWGLYQGFMNKGFNEEQSMRLVLTYSKSNFCKDKADDDQA